MANLIENLFHVQEPHITRVLGPLPNTCAIRSADAQARDYELVLPEPVAGRGSLGLWLRLDNTYGTGRTDTINKHAQRLLEIPRVVKIGFYSYEHQLALTTEWQHIDGVKDTGPLLPGLPAGWVHYAIRWDAERGRIEHFLNGSPLEQPGYRTAAWTPEGAATTVRVTLERFDLAQLAVDPTLFTNEDLRETVPQLMRGSLDHVLGLREAPQVELGPYQACRMSYRNMLERPEDIAGWKHESEVGVVEFVDGTMQLSTGPKGDGHGNMVLWCDVELPARFFAEWQVRVLSKESLLIVFFNAAGRQGEDLFSSALPTRDGDFKGYIKGAINTYHASYFASGRGTSNLRKNHGFHLVANGPIGIPRGDHASHRVSVLRDGPQCAVFVDGRRVLEFVDDGTTYGRVLTGGKLGFRQMNGAVARYRDLRIHDLAGGRS